MDFVTSVVKSSFNIKDLLQSTGSATKASFSVLLVLLYGYLSRKYKWLSKETEDVSYSTATSVPSDLIFAQIQQISELCVTFFLPSLLFSEIGPLATPRNLASCKQRNSRNEAEHG